MIRGARARRAWPVALVAVAVATAWPSPETRASALCADAQRAGVPDAPADDPLAVTARSVWLKVYGTFFAATGRQTELAVLGPEARRADGQPFPPHAFICPRSSPSGPAPPRIYLTWSLLERVRAHNRFDVSFLGLVLGHELGHRARHFEADGRPSPGVVGGVDVERQADASGAFYTARAGYGTRRLVCDDVMDLFLEVEADVPEGARRARKGALGDALRAFDVYESLYDAASALTFWSVDDAQAILGWLIEDVMEARGHEIAEMYFLRGLAHLIEGAASAPLLQPATLPDAPLGQLRCLPIFPAHTGLWDDVLARQARRSSADALEAAIADFERARAMGAHPLPVLASTGCARLYLEDLAGARADLERAERRLGPEAPEAVEDALAGNLAMLAWAEWMAENPAPRARAPEGERRAWGQRLRAAATPFRAHEGLRALIARLDDYPRVAAAPAVAPDAACEDAPSDAPGAATMPPLPTSPRAGGCPCGWRLLHHLDEPASSSQDTGVRTCVPAGWGAGVRFVDIAVPRGPRVRMLMDDAPRGPLARLGTWQRGCDVLEPRGVSDAGDRVFGGLCPALGARQAIVLADEACGVRRAISLGSYL